MKNRKGTSVVSVKAAAQAAARSMSDSAGLGTSASRRSSLDLRGWAMLLAGSAASLTAGRADAVTVTESATAPTANILTSQLTDSTGGLVGSQDYTDNGGPPGQTFSVAGSGHYQMTGFTILGGNNFGTSSGVPWTVQIGAVDPITGAITELDNETGVVTIANGADYLNFNLGTSQTLDKGKTYEFSLFSSAGYFGLAHSATDVYSGGTAFNNDAGTTDAGNVDTKRAFNGFVSPRNYDYVFAVQGVNLANVGTWSGSVNSNWDTTTPNFTGVTYIEGAAVTFADVDGNGNPVTNRIVNIQAGGVTPTSVVVNNSAGAYTFNGSILNTTLSKQGSDIATLSGTTDNTGLVATVSGGTLVLAKASSSTVHAVSGLTIANGATAQLAGSGGDQIPDSASVVNSGTFDLNGNSETINVLTGPTTGSITNNGPTAATFTLGAGNGFGTYSGQISDGAHPLTLVKVGTGTQTLAGTSGSQNFFSGGVIINAGTLALGADSGNTESTGALASGTIAVNAGGMLRFGGAGGARVDYTVFNNIALDGGTIFGVDGYHHLTGVLGVTTNGATLMTRWGNKDLSIEGDLTGSGPITVKSDLGAGGQGDGGVHFGGTLSYTGTITTAPTLFSGTTVTSGSGHIYLDSATALQNATINLLAGSRGLTLNAGNASYVVGGLSGTGTTIDLIGGQLNVGNINTSTTFGGNIVDSSSNGAFVKVGTGTLTLSGTNTYAGQTLIQGGTLRVAGGTASRAIPSVSAVVISTGTTFDLAGSNVTIGSLADDANTPTGHRVTLGSGTLSTGNDNTSTSFSGTISGAGGSLVKVGTGTFTLAGTHTYTGSTIVRGGTLALSSTSSNNIPTSSVVQAAAGGTLDVTGLSGGVLALNNQNLKGGGVVNGSVTVSGANGAISPGDLAIGTLTFNNDLTLNNNTNLNFVLGTPGVVGAPGLGSLVNVLGNLNLSGSLNFKPLNNGNANGQGSLGAGIYELFSYNGALTGFDPSHFLTPRTANFSFSNIAHTGGGGEIDVYVAALTALKWTGATDSNWDTTTTNWANGAAASLYSDGVITTFADTNPITGAPITNNNVVVQAAGVTPNSVAFTNSLIDYTIGNAASGTVGITGTTGIEKNGTGKVTFLSPNTFSGAVNVNAGTLAISDSGALGTSSVVTVINGATLQLQNNINVGAIPLSLSGTGAGSGSGALASVSGTNSYTGAVTLAGDTTISVNADSLTLSAPVSGSAGLTKAGGGNLALTALNTYTGNTTVNAGILTLNKGGQTGSLLGGTSLIVNPGGFVQLNAGDNLGYNTGAVNLVINGGTVSAGTANRVTLWNPVNMIGGKLTAAGAGDANGSYSLNGDIIATSDAAGNPAQITAAKVSLQAASGQNGAVTFNVTRGPAAPAADMVVSSVIAPFGASTAGVIKSGNGALMLTAANTYTGPTTVSAGTLQLGNGTTLNGSIVGPLANAGTVVFANPNAQNYSSVISGAGNVVKTGAGNLALKALNTYSGGTTINAGTVSVMADTALGSGSVSLSTGTLNFAGGGSNVGQAIGVKFMTSRAAAATTYPVTGPAGVVPIVSWNNIAGSKSTTPTTGLVDGSGNVTTASLDSFAGSGTYDVFNATQANPNAQLMNAFVDNSTTATPSVYTFSGIPYQNYDVYAYVGSDGNGRTGNVSANGTKYYYSTRVNSGGFVGFLQTTSTNTATHTTANYAVFTNQAGSTLTVNQVRESNNNGVFGFEIVAAPTTTVQFANNIQLNAGAVLDANPGITANLTGQLTGVGGAAPSLVKGSNTGTVELAQTAAQTFSGITVNGGTLGVGAAATGASAPLTVTGTMNVADGASMNFLPNTAARITNTVGTLNLNASGNMDLGNHAILTSTTDNIRAYVVRAAGPVLPSNGLNGWTGKGLTSSLVKTDAAAGNAKQLAVGYFDSRDNAQTGLSVPAGQTLVQYTVYGDATGDSKVDIADLSVWNNNFGAGNRWSQGDFNYDGRIDIADLSVWNNDFGNQLTGGTIKPGVRTAGAVAAASSAVAGHATPTLTSSASASASPAATPLPATLELDVNTATGDATLNSGGVTLAAIELDSASGILIKSGWQSLRLGHGFNQWSFPRGTPSATSLSEYTSDASSASGQPATLAAGTLTDYGLIFPVGFSDPTDLTFKYNIADPTTGLTAPRTGTVVFTSSGVPEPTCLALGSVAAMGLLSRKRRSR